MLGRILGAVLGLAATASSGTAGTVITNNLPPGTAIVNIDARVDGAAGYNGDQSLWYHPFNGSSGPLLQLPIQAGTYTFRVIDPADAAKTFPDLSSAQTNQIYTGWTYNSPWILNYLVFDAAAATNFNLPQIFDGDPEWPPFGNAQAVYDASLAHSTYKEIRVGPLGRASRTLTNNFTFGNPTALIFAVPDYGLYDNAGGVSVLVSPVGPPLSIATGPGGVTVKWSSAVAGFDLFESTDVQNGPWTQVTAPVTVDQNNFSVVLGTDSARKFYRLYHP